jgi:putative tricarboxylic transport membrane protein
MSSLKRAAPGELLLGLGVAALGVFIAVETGNIRVAPVYAKVGPTLIPGIVAGGLVLLGLLVALTALRGHREAATDAAAEPNDWLGMAAVGVGLWQQIFLLRPAGFLVSAALLYFCVAYGFGSRRYLRDAAIAIVLATVVHVGFTRGLGLQLPAGVLEGVL